MRFLFTLPLLPSIKISINITLAALFTFPKAYENLNLIEKPENFVFRFFLCFLFVIRCFSFVNFLSFYPAKKLFFVIR